MITNPHKFEREGRVIGQAGRECAVCDQRKSHPNHDVPKSLTLTEFLLARIAEDRRTATEAQWAMQNQWYPAEPDADDRHVARWSPVRVMAECEAKRRIVERLLFVQEGDTTEHAWHEQGLFEAVGFLALPYADHPDYQQEWAV